ncbi:MAG: ABC transporter substrate-binding protein [Thermodesulfobacteriota bacterium]
MYKINLVIGIIVLLIVLTFFITSLSRAGEVRGVTDDTIKIGVILDQTGIVANLSIPITNGSKTYFRHINDQGGINGRNVKVIVEDDHYTIPGAIAAFKKLVFRDEVLSVLFAGGTGQIFALLSQIEKHKVPVIPVSLTEAITTPVKRYIFTPTAGYDDTIKLGIDYIMKDLKAKNPKIAFVYPDNEFGKNGLQAAEKYLINYNLKFSNKTVINLGEIDATSQVLVLKKENPDYIILHNGFAGLISFFKAAKKYGLRSKVIGTFYVSDEDNIKVTGDAMKDSLAVSPMGYWSDNTTGMVQLRKITKKYYPEAKRMVRSYTQGWLTSMICAEGLKRAGKNLNPDTLVEAYETFKHFSTGGIAGPVSYSKNNHKGGTMGTLYKVDIENQTFIPITEFREPAFKD